MSATLQGRVVRTTEDIASEAAQYAGLELTGKLGFALRCYELVDPDRPGHLTQRGAAEAITAQGFKCSQTRVREYLAMLSKIILERNAFTSDLDPHNREHRLWADDAYTEVRAPKAPKAIKASVATPTGDDPDILTGVAVPPKASEPIQAPKPAPPRPQEPEEDYGPRPWPIEPPPPRLEDLPVTEADMYSDDWIAMIIGSIHGYLVLLERYSRNPQSTRQLVIDSVTEVFPKAIKPSVAKASEPLAPKPQIGTPQNAPDPEPLPEDWDIPLDEREVTEDDYLTPDYEDETD